MTRQRIILGLGAERMAISIRSLFAAILISILSPTINGQSISIGAPANGTTLTAGSTVVVQVVRSVCLLAMINHLLAHTLNATFQITLSTIDEISLLIGIQFCPICSCPAPSSSLGTILSTIDDYNPQIQLGLTLLPYQNFTVTIPALSPLGKAQLNFAHFSLIGVGVFHSLFS